MPVYEAETKADLKKILSFLKAQPTETLTGICFKLWRAEKTMEKFFEFIKTQGYKVFYTEDSNGNIRAVSWVQIISGEGVDTHYRNLGGLLDYRDYQARNFQFLKETLEWNAKKAVEKGNFRADFQLPEERAITWQKLLGDAMTVKLKQPHPTHPELGTIWFFQIDWRKYLGLT